MRVLHMKNNSLFAYKYQNMLCCVINTTCKHTYCCYYYRMLWLWVKINQEWLRAAIKIQKCIRSNMYINKLLTSSEFFCLAVRGNSSNCKLYQFRDPCLLLLLKELKHDPIFSMNFYYNQQCRLSLVCIYIHKWMYV